MTIVVSAAVASSGTKGSQPREGSPLAFLTAGIKRHRIDRLTDEGRDRHSSGVGRAAQPFRLPRGQLDLRAHHANMIAPYVVMLYMMSS